MINFQHWYFPVIFHQFQTMIFRKISLHRRWQNGLVGHSVICEQIRKRETNARRSYRNNLCVAIVQIVRLRVSAYLHCALAFFGRTGVYIVCMLKAKANLSTASAMATGRVGWRWSRGGGCDIVPASQ